MTAALRLAEALMAYLGIGVKVATLPVIALGVEVGVDYGIYIYSKMTSFLRSGMSVQEAYYNTLTTTGEAVSLTAIMLAVGVTTWIWSPIKFQADMGILLTFMFVWNMVGALWLLPALARADADGGPGGALLAPGALGELAAFEWGDELPGHRIAQLRGWWADIAAERAHRSPAAVIDGGTGRPTATDAKHAAGLTARELEILARIAAGESNKLIARAFDLSLHTVKRHVANILDKLALSTRGQAAAWYRDNAPRLSL